MACGIVAAAGAGLPMKLVHASRGKVARAEPVAALFERGAARLAGRFPLLEAELTGLQAGGGYQGPGRSPDRADAMVWAMWELALTRPAASGVRAGGADRLRGAPTPLARPARPRYVRDLARGPAATPGSLRVRGRPPLHHPIATTRPAVGGGAL